MTKKKSQTWGRRWWALGPIEALHEQELAQAESDREVEAMLERNGLLQVAL